MIASKASKNFVGVTFPPSYQWHTDETCLIDQLLRQIETAYPHQHNLLVNTTWFGPQFDNGAYEDFLQEIDIHPVDNLFFLAAADPVFLNPDQLAHLVKISACKTVTYLGHFDGEYYFNFHAMVLPKYFRQYHDDDLVLRDIKWLFVNYNRKPRVHRVDLVNKLVQHDLDRRGLISLGRNDEMFSQTTEQTACFLLNEEPDDYAQEGNWGMDMRYGIPHDIHSLGNMQIWQNHFITVVSETEFWPWDNMFISEKTWKPILGLRPFVINGQQKIYHYLRQQGFRTFEKYWPSIDIEQQEVHQGIVDLLLYLAGLSTQELIQLWRSMLPDLLHNRDRFHEFSREQCLKIGNLLT